MKLTELLTVVCCSIIMSRSETIESSQEAFLKKASEQLERLAPFRRIADRGKVDLSDLRKIWRNEDLDGTKSDVGQTVPWELFAFVPEETQTVADAAKRVDDEKPEITIDIITDSKDTAAMQERNKRGYDSGGFNLITGIAGGVLSGVATASKGSAASASSSSSQFSKDKQVYGAPAYGAPAYDAPVYDAPAYGAPGYGVPVHPIGHWDFKKAIFGTLFRALKAISGGVLALKGQLVKGSGYLLSAKGKVISKTGDVITSFGKNLATNAITYPSYGAPSYTTYDQPPIHNIGYDTNYAGPPPSSSEYSEVSSDYNAHSNYAHSSDDNVQGGLLVVTETKSDLDQHSDHHTSVVQEKPDLTKLEESFGGPSKGSAIKNLLNSVPIGSAGITDHQALSQNNKDSYPPPPPGQAALTYDTSNNHFTNYNDLPQNDQTYPAALNNAYHFEPLKTPVSHHIPNLVDHLSIQQSLEYPPLHLQHFHHPVPNPKPPHDDGASIYTSFSIDTEPQITLLKVPLPGYPGVSDLPKYQHIDFLQRPHLTSLHGALGTQGPLKIPILNPLQANHWQDQQSHFPPSAYGTLNSFHKRNIPEKRTFADRLAHYSSSLRKMKSHRL